MEQIKIINLENVSKEEISKYEVRRAARAVVFDENKNVALLHATKNFYYKLPGGGIEENESIEEALKRECLEEIGCNVEILSELGEIDEGFETVWLPIEEAVRRIKESQPIIYEGPYMVTRDTAFLESAKKIFN